MEEDHGGKALIDESKSGRLYVYFDEWKGAKFLHIRFWYQDKNDGAWKPGLKGVAIPEGWLKKFLEALKVILR
jgi:hypothetical protein